MNSEVFTEEVAEEQWNFCRAIAAALRRSGGSEGAIAFWEKGAADVLASKYPESAAIFRGETAPKTVFSKKKPATDGGRDITKASFFVESAL